MPLTIEEARKKLLEKRGKKCYIPELLGDIGKVRSRDDRIALIRAYLTIDPIHAKLLQSFTEISFHPVIVWRLPIGGDVPYEPGPKEYGKARSSLFVAQKQFKFFVSDLMPNAAKREMMFLNILSSIHAQEAQALIAAKDKDFSEWRGVTEKLFVAALPQFFPPGYQPEEDKK